MTIKAARGILLSAPDKEVKRIINLTFPKKDHSMGSLVVKNLNVSIENQPILMGVNLVVPQGEVHAIMGPNATGKSTLAYTIMGHPKYTLTEGQILLDGKDITGLSTEERSKAGIFLAFQYPVAIPGVTVANFITDRDECSPQIRQSRG